MPAASNASGCNDARRASGAASCGADRTRCAPGGTARPAGRRPPACRPAADLDERGLDVRPGHEHAGRHEPGDAGRRPVRDLHADRAVRAACRGAAQNRSPTSRCTITSIRSICGTPSSRSQTSGVATLYGRLATSAQPPCAAEQLGPVEPPSRRPRRRARSVPLERPRAARGTTPRSTSTAVTVGPGLGQRQRQRAEPGADLDHPVAGPDLGEPGDAAHGVRVGDEVLPEVASRAPGPWAREQLVDAGAAVHRLPGDAHRHRRVGQVGDRGEQRRCRATMSTPAGRPMPKVLRARRRLAVVEVGDGELDAAAEARACVHAGCAAAVAAVAGAHVGVVLAAAARAGATSTTAGRCRASSSPPRNTGDSGS